MILVCRDRVQQDWCSGRHQPPAFSSRAGQLRSATNPSCSHFAVRPGMGSDGLAEREWDFDGIKIFVGRVADWKTSRQKNWEAKACRIRHPYGLDISSSGFSTRPGNVEASSRCRSESDGELVHVGAWPLPRWMPIASGCVCGYSYGIEDAQLDSFRAGGAWQAVARLPLSAGNAGASGVVGASTSFGARKRTPRTSCCALLRA